MEIDCQTKQKVKLECGTCEDGTNITFDYYGGEDYKIRNKVYPVRSSYKSHHEYPDLGDWDETHYCPGCKKEFTINVASY